MNNRKRMASLPQAAGLAAALALLPGTAEAHAFQYGAGFYADFVQGNSVVLTDPVLLIAAVAAGLAFAIWREDGMPLAWPGLALGTVIGALLARFDLIYPLYAAMICALGMGALGALAVKLPVWPMRAVGLVAGFLLAVATLSGHTANTIPPGVYFGVVFALNIVVVATAAISIIARQKFQQNWMLIALRTLSSWMIAMTVMMGTLALAAG